MADYYEVDFLAVETSKSGDAITLRYSVDGTSRVHVVDGGYLDTGDKIVEHIEKFYGSKNVDHVVLTHSDQDHANGLRKVLEECNVGALWMNRPWEYAGELIHRFETYNSVDALRSKLRSVYAAPAALEDIAIAKGIPIHAPLQGQTIGAFTVLAPTKSRYLDLIVASNKTPEAAKDALSGIMEGVFKAMKSISNFVKSAWGDEYFPPEGTSSENEMSVVQYAYLNGQRVLLTGDAGRDALAEAADFAPMAGLTLPGIKTFQVPHHGGRHNVSTEILDRWLGVRLPEIPATTTWNAICSSAELDEAHPRKSVVRAMLHRGAHFAKTEGRNVCISSGISRDGWSALPQEAYPEEQER